MCTAINIILINIILINIILITIITVGYCDLIWLIEVINWEARLTGLQEGASPEMRGI